MKTVTVNTAELEGAALDWAVAKATGMHVRVDIWPVNGLHWPYEDNLSSGYGKRVFPSTDWSQGGPIISKYRPEIIPVSADILYNHNTMATAWRNGKSFNAGGKTYLIAAMRAIVAAELGNTVEIPQELTQ